MSLGFGLLSVQVPGGTAPDWPAAYARSLRMAEHAEATGFDSVWLTEHHFVDDGYLPSLLPMCAAIAARTRRISIGTAVVLAPLHHPLRLAEDAAVVQLVSGGRLLLGLGLGWSEIEYAALGVARSRRGAAMEELLTLLPRAWTGEPFQHEGAVYSFPRLAIRPTPGRPIPVLVGGAAGPALRRAARLADGVFLTTDQNPGLAGATSLAGGLLDQVQLIRAELGRAGRDPAAFHWWCYLIMYPCDDPQSGWWDIRHHVWQSAWKYGDMVASAARPGPPPAAPPPDPAVLETIRRRDVLIGPGEDIVASLRSIREDAGVPLRFVAKSCFPSLPPAHQFEVMDRLAEQVAPFV